MSYAIGLLIERFFSALSATRSRFVWEATDKLFLLDHRLVAPRLDVSSRGIGLAYKARDGSIAAENVETSYLRALSSLRAKKLNSTTWKIKVPIERGEYARRPRCRCKTVCHASPDVSGRRSLVLVGKYFSDGRYSRRKCAALVSESRSTEIRDEFKTGDPNIWANEREEEREKRMSKGMRHTLVSSIIYRTPFSCRKYSHCGMQPRHSDTCVKKKGGRVLYESLDAAYWAFGHLYYETTRAVVGIH